MPIYRSGAYLTGILRGCNAPSLCDTCNMVRRTFDVDALLGSIRIFREGGRRPAEVFAAAGVDDVSDEEFVAAARLVLRDRPDLVEVWQGWSYDKRWTPSPYLDVLEVGHYDAGKQHVRRHATAADACADFVLAEARWVVDRRVVEPTTRDP